MQRRIGDGDLAPWLARRFLVMANLLIVHGEIRQKRTSKPHHFSHVT